MQRSDQIRIDDVLSIQHHVLPFDGTQAVSHIVRIIQEAVTNAIKHASASMIGLHVFTSEENQVLALNIVVSDNGKGVVQKVNHGVGLLNMQQRALNANAILTVNNSTRGTQIEMILPLVLNGAKWVAV